MIIEDRKKKKKNLGMTWIDYRKAYDSVPHSWKVQTFQMYRFNENLISEQLENYNNATLQLWMYHNGSDQDPKKGLSRRFSPLLFCLALVPLTSELASSGYGYKVKKHKCYNQQSVFI